MSNTAPLVIHNNTGSPYIAEQDRDHFNATVANAFRFTDAATVERVDVYINPRGVMLSSPSWLEHIIVVKYVSEDRHPMRIGCIQRLPGSESEFCS